VTTFICALLFLCSGVSGSFAGSVEVGLTWDPVTGTSPLGYKVYYGTSSGRYDVSIDVGNTTSYTVSGLDRGRAYFFAATAYYDSRTESNFSNELVYTTPLEITDGQPTVRPASYVRVNLPEIVPDVTISASQGIQIPIPPEASTAASCTGVFRVGGLNASHVHEPWVSASFVDPYDLQGNVRTGVGIMMDIILGGMTHAIVWIGARDVADYYTIAWWSDAASAPEFVVLDARQAGEHRLLIGIDEDGVVDVWLDDDVIWSAGVITGYDLYVGNVYLVGESTHCAGSVVFKACDWGLGYTDAVLSPR
jgi:hypothetical protein